MPGRRLTEQDVLEARRLVEQYGGVKPASRATGIPENTLRRRSQLTQLSPRQTHCGVCGSDQFDTSGNCRPCANKRNQAYKARHAEKVKDARAEYKRRNKATISEKNLDYRRRKAAERMATYTPRVRTEEERKLLAEKRRRNRLASRLKWKQANAHKVNASTAKRFASKMRATPAWADKKAIDQYYLIAGFLSDALGVEFHVDHIVPLRGETVQGFHSQHNLNIALGSWNISKSNRWWPDMPVNVDEPKKASSANWVGWAA